MSLYKKASLHEEEKRDVAEIVVPAQDNMDAIATQIKTEILHSLREVEQSREMTLKDIEDLKQTKEGIELQLAALQQSLNQVTEKTLDLQKTKNETSKQQIEDSRKQLKEKTFVRQQGYLKDQLRQQVSRRAEILEEERRKAGQSLEGLKSKLKQLETVITRKDSAVQDFRIELAKSRVEKEKSVDMEKEMDELRRRLEDVESERDTVKTQLNHLTSLGEQTAPLSEAKGFDALQKKLDYVASKLSFMENTRDNQQEEREVFTSKVFGHTSRSHRRPSSDNKRPQERDRELRDCESKDTKKLRKYQEKFYESEEDDDLGVLSQEPSKPTVVGTGESISDVVRVQRKPSSKFLTRNKDLNKDNNDVSDDGLREGSFRETSSPLKVSKVRQRMLATGSRDMGQSPEARNLLRDKERTYWERDHEIHRDSVLGLTSKKAKGANKTKKDRYDFEGSKPDLVTVSSIADDKKTKFLATVNRLKNEKLRELEIGLQNFLKS